MDQELRELLEKNLKISEENNDLLKKMHRSQRWSMVMSAMYWLFIVGITFGVYYYLQPYITTLLETYTSLIGGIEDIQQKTQSFPDANTISDFLKGLNIQR